MKQLFRDLKRNANDRFMLWIKDTIMRCEAIDLEHQECVSMILSIIVEQNVYGFKKMGMSENDFLILMQDSFRKCHVKVEKISCEDGK